MSKGTATRKECARVGGVPVHRIARMCPEVCFRAVVGTQAQPSPSLISEPIAALTRLAQSSSEVRQAAHRKRPHQSLSRPVRLSPRGRASGCPHSGADAMCGNCSQTRTPSNRGASGRRRRNDRDTRTELSARISRRMHSYLATRPPATTTQGRFAGRPGLVSTAAARCMANVTGHNTPSAWYMSRTKSRGLVWPTRSRTPFRRGCQWPASPHWTNVILSQKSDRPLPGSWPASTTWR